MSSALDQLRAKYQEIAARETVEIPLPHFAGDLVARYRLLDQRHDIAPILKRAEKLPEAERELAASADLLIAACVGLIARQPDDSMEELVDGQGEPIVYDHRLADGLGIEAQNPRQLLHHLFHDGPALIGHARRLQLWMSDTSLDVGQTFLGEA